MVGRALGRLRLAAEVAVLAVAAVVIVAQTVYELGWGQNGPRRGE